MVVSNNICDIFRKSFRKKFSNILNIVPTTTTSSVLYIRGSTFLKKEILNVETVKVLVVNAGLVISNI